MLTRRSWFVYGALLAIWIALIGWQGVEHIRNRRQARALLRHRAEDISNVIGVIMRSQQRVRGVNLRQRLEPSFNELVKQGELISVELLNATNGQVASAGPPIDPQTREELLNEEDDIHDEESRGPELWDNRTQTVALMNLVDLGTNIVVVDANEPIRSSTNNPAATTPAVIPMAPDSTNAAVARTNDSPSAANPTNLTNTAAVSTQTNALSSGDTNRPPGNFGEPRRRFGPGRRLTPEEIKNRGVHNFIIVLSTQAVLSAARSDLWLRIFIATLATMSVAGYGLAWGNLTKTSELQIRLVRASELNSHLKELNVAAAGLAHETRNPLNIVRGLAQMISKREDAAPEIRSKSREIIDETDRVTAQLNEFINYSRPREVRRAATNLNSVVGEVVRALNYDLDEKKVQLQVVADPLTIEADEQLLRQALFNLALNAIQAVPAHGAIHIRAGRNGTGAFVEVADNGPGIAPEHRAEIFKPYFTTHVEGTGLGLAVVQQIVLAHGWEIECTSNQPAGAVFRITHIKAFPRP